MNQFVGRKQELKDLNRLSSFRRVCLVVIQGRRRIGKSRLVQEFAKNKRFLSFTGEVPTKASTAQAQRDAFSKRVAELFNVEKKKYDSWADAFCHISSVHTSLLTDEPTVILFDEVSWMATDDERFIPQFKTWFDQDLQKWPQLILILCGSVSTWIEKNILRSTALFGRISLTINLKPLSLAECATFLRLRGFKGSSYEILKILAITGGISRYLEEISPDELADDNIKRLCFRPEGFLTTDFNFIFHDLFNGNSSVYKEIIHMLAVGMKNLSDIKKILGNTVAMSDVGYTFPTENSLEDLVNNLIIAGFVTKHYTWSLKSEKKSTDYIYRLSDNYIRFYTKYIEPNEADIHTNTYVIESLTNLLGWDSTMGLHVENLLLNNRDVLLKSIEIPRADIIADNPYIQRTSDGERGCQIDYLIQTHSKNLFVCEFKFNKHLLGSEVITSVQEKIKRLDVSSEFGIIPVLFHMGEVTPAVLNKNYFYRIINIADLLGSDEE